MNIANYVTLSRIPLLFIVVGLMYFRIPFGSTLCFLVYLLAALSDWLDGYLARRCDIVSTFGKFMDALTDKIFMVGLFVAILVLGILPQWTLFFVLFIIGREFLVTGVRLVASSRGIILEAERIGKVKTVMQIVTIGFFILWRAVVEDLKFFPDWFGIFIRYCAMILFLITTYLTLSSGYHYIQRYKHLFDDQRKEK
ncbi:MAG: CDP-diacylglycerol--glycerol-3-phosphate 3-phosphatidyltransferase [Puniceicoccales bacterium]|jgi:CDP-diacylglycerol--glycerol-3-phosphate 3-phosphatidyltransferase|nr:CDP-diacylglycerol--glycerol-3-phosphate 3-phosphatidyltransferase [Puniceicoccales bacterium]